jgi:hypothetical protein
MPFYCFHRFEIKINILMGVWDWIAVMGDEMYFLKIKMIYFVIIKFDCDFLIF